MKILLFYLKIDFQIPQIVDEFNLIISFLVCFVEKLKGALLID